MHKDTFSQKLHAKFDTIETRYRPDVRWWLAEGMHTDETLRKNIRQLHELGFGAAEFLAMPEPGADSSLYGWGSQEWTDDTRLIIREATRLGMGFSLTSGAHWASANLPDTYVWQGQPYNPDSKAAAKELDYATVLVSGGQRFDGQLPLCPPTKSVAGDFHGAKMTCTRYDFQGVVAAKLLEKRENCGQDFGYAEGQGTGKLCLDSLTDLSGFVTEKDGKYYLDWIAPEGEWALFIYWMHGTCQIAGPSVSTNYTINYMDKYGVEALIDYWEAEILTDELRQTIRQNGRGEIYMDSLELPTYGAGGLYWGYDLKEEFTRRKGYDITRYLPVICSDIARVESSKPNLFDYTVPENQLDTAEKVRTDYYDVISKLYCENVLAPLQKWLHSLGMTLRAEPAYGTHFEISTPARYVDGIETESFAQVADGDLYRGMLGSANVYGRVFSSETGAVRGFNYFYNMDTWTQLCYLQFALGVNRTVFHGYSAIEGSEADTYWPGHEGMYPRFAGRFGGRQPSAPHYRDWTDMLGRCQKMLRQGRPQRDIAILRTDYRYVNYGQPMGYNTFESNFFMHDMPYFWKDLSLQRAGYTYDFFSPQLLLDEDVIRYDAAALLPEGPAYRALIVYQEQLEPTAAEKLLQIAEAGLPVLFVNNAVETRVHNAPDLIHGKAAGKSPFLGCPDGTVAALTERIKQLPNVYELDSQAEVLPLLQKLGIQPRAGYAEPNSRIMTCSRRDGDTFYTFAYCYKFKLEQGQPACRFTLRLEGEGAPYLIDQWSGKVTALGAYRHENGFTCVDMSLIPGQAALIALDLRAKDAVHVDSADKMVVRKEGKLYRRVTEAPAVLEKFHITVEDWNEGDKVVLTEEKFGHVTTEVYFETKKTRMSFPDSPLVPWKDLPGQDMEKVSGLGTYEAAFIWQGGNAMLELENAGGGTVQIWVNDRKAAGVDTRTLTLDISDLVRQGENTLKIQVSSTLYNRMLARGYQQRKSRWDLSGGQVQAYGLTGKVRIIPYRDEPVE